MSQLRIIENILTNRCLEQYLWSFVHQKPKSWVQYLPWTEFWYNTTYHSSTGTSPFEAVYGRSPPSIPHYHIGTSPIEELDKQLESREEILSQLRNHLSRSINHMKQVEDSKRRHEEFTVENEVFLKLYPYRQHSVFRRVSHKLTAHYYEPFQIIEKINPVTCRLDMSMGSRIHTIFHISLLKRKVGNLSESSPTLPPFANNGGFEL